MRHINLGSDRDSGRTTTMLAVCGAFANSLYITATQSLAGQARLRSSYSVLCCTPDHAERIMRTKKPTCVALDDISLWPAGEECKIRALVVNHLSKERNSTLLEAS